jgi:hypothetical protein
MRFHPTYEYLSRRLLAVGVESEKHFLAELWRRMRLAELEERLAVLKYSEHILGGSNNIDVASAKICGAYAHTVCSSYHRGIKEKTTLTLGHAGRTYALRRGPLARSPTKSAASAQPRAALHLAGSLQTGMSTKLSLNHLIFNGSFASWIVSSLTSLPVP